MNHAMAGRILVACLMFLTLGGCQASSHDRPTDTGRLMQTSLCAAETGDHSQIPTLVSALDHDDAVVRMMAIQALERLTGTRLGYHPYGSAVKRHQAVERWRQAVASGTFENQTAMETSGH